jgi:hypothetical protein
MRGPEDAALEPLTHCPAMQYNSGGTDETRTRDLRRDRLAEDENVSE